MLLKISSPETVYIRFTEKNPTYFELKDQDGTVYFFRYLDGRTNRIKFNIPDPGFYSSNYDFDIVKIAAIEVPDHFPTLPPAERNRFKEVTYKFNPTLTGTPARIFTDTGVIEHSAVYYTYPKPIRLFIDLHESGHMLYKTEEFCDMWALINYLRMGYNRSMAYYTLSHILKTSGANIERLKFLLTQIQVTQNEKL